MSDDGKVIDIYDWHRPLKPGELPRGCYLTELPMPPETEQTKQLRRMRLSELALAISLVVLLSLLIASFV